ncbi:MAG TPA: FAD-binding oxidoreductase [Rectinemataceae bacterium]|nr:FAD-binding oxidoreductase [Rectinemataceae bacterium]
MEALKPETSFRTRLLARTWLSSRVFECILERPEGFSFRPGQAIRLSLAGVERDYSIASGPGEPGLRLCVKRIEGGALSPALAALPIGGEMGFSGPRGFFFIRGSSRPRVLVATGTGVAPFRSMAETGLVGYTLLHGVREAGELFYRDRLEPGAARYVPCLSAGPGQAVAGGFAGRVGAWVEAHLERRAWDFYLCGHRGMIRDLSLLVDESFPGSRLFCEIFD